MSIVVLFGHPGTGKTYIGRIFAKHFGYFFYEGDDDLTEEMKSAIKVQRVFTDKMRAVFFERLIGRIHNLSLKHNKLVVAQTFIREEYRMDLLRKVPEAKFVLVETNESIREKRLELRKDYPLDMEYARKMVVNFERPRINHQTLTNNENGEENIVRQIRLLDI